MLVLEKLTKTFPVGGGSVKVAVNRVDLTIEKGQFVTVIGSNGAGKSTLLNLIAGRYLPDRGRIILDGVDITRWSEHRRAQFIGRVFQDPLQGTAASMTIEENLSMAELRGRRRTLARGVTPARRARYRELLAPLGLGLETRLQSEVGLLSGGQRQSLSLIMATMNHPSLLLLDEHTAALDPKTAKQVLDLTTRIVGEYGLTTLMVTHNLEHALRIGDRTIMMHEGSIVLDLSGPERARMTVQDLLQEFTRVRGADLVDDRLLLA
ncbi:MAG: ABC transporter ATP-binding protein [Bacillota bacterium]|nr:ABC transporter ATP-binding protein [Bacillota bacterium]REJ35941.1 MAG: ABC transporter ATP-binding protein [Bacillota bacterium]